MTASMSWCGTRHQNAPLVAQLTAPSALEAATQGEANRMGQSVPNREDALSLTYHDVEPQKVPDDGVECR